MENKANKDKHKINQSEKKQEKNVNRNLNPSIKEIDFVELFGLNTTKYLREMCSLNMSMIKFSRVLIYKQMSHYNDIQLEDKSIETVFCMLV